MKDQTTKARLQTLLDNTVSVLAVLFAVYTIFYAYTLLFIRLRYSIHFVGLGLGLFYLISARDSLERRLQADGSTVSSGQPIARLREIKRRIDPVVSVLSAVVVLLATAYVEYHFQRLHEDVFLQGYTQLDLYVGVALIVLAIDATRRAFGNIIASVAITTILYAYAPIGNALPGVLRHSGFEWTEISRAGAIGLTGIYHETLMGIGSTWVAIFLVFAGIAKAYGLMEFILDIGEEAGKKFKSGVVQMAVVGSMIMGSVTGAAVANAATTGSFTIPMMKEQGIRKDFAAATEAVASTGGQMLPPIMGVAAFLMADILGISYLSVIRAGVIPALLFYVGVGAAVYLGVLKNDWTVDEVGTFDRGILAKILKKGMHFLLPLGVLLYTLIWLRFTPLTAGMYTIFALFVSASAKTLYDAVSTEKLNGNTVVRLGRDAVNGLRQGGEDLAPLVGVIAVMGVIVEVLVQTGLTQRVSTLLIGLGGGNLLLILLLAMVLSVLFGMGMPTVAAYILVVILVAPTVTQVGIEPLTTHMFVFYFAMLSAVTPPVAMGVVVGSRIADSNFVSSCIQALRIAAPGFIVPFSFIVNENLLHWSSATLLEFPVVLLGSVGISVAVIGYDGRNTLSYPVRAMFVVLALGAMFGVVISSVVQIGSAIVIAGYLLKITGFPKLAAEAAN